MIVLSMLVTLADKLPNRFEVDRAEFLKPVFHDHERGITFSPNGDTDVADMWLLTELGVSDIAVLWKVNGLTWQESILNAIVDNYCRKAESAAEVSA